jgi:hypothetical protein
MSLKIGTLVESHLPMICPQPVLEGSTDACFIVRDTNGQARWRMSI